MFLNIKLFFLAILLASATHAQQIENKESEATQETKPTGRKVGNISLGAYIPIPFGDNYINNAVDVKPGARFSLKINALGNFYAGPYLSFFSGSVNDRQSVGNYTRSNNFTVGALVGYEKQINKFDLSLGVGIGASVFSNNGAGDNFKDTGTAVWLNPELSYRFTTYWAVYIAPELRHDFMDIDVPDELEDSFKNVNYLNISFGLRINLGSGYKNL